MNWSEHPEDLPEEEHRATTQEYESYPPREEPTTPTTTTPTVTSGRHPVNVGHLVMGVAFLGLTLVWALVVSDAVSLADHQWLLPAPWIIAGAAGLAASAGSRARRATTPRRP